MAPVLSQPSLPFGVSASHRAGLHLSDGDLEKVRAAREGRLPGARDALHRAIPSARASASTRCGASSAPASKRSRSTRAPAIAFGIKRLAHSVVTEDLVDSEGHPTRAALERVLAFFAERLRAA